MILRVAWSNWKVMPMHLFYQVVKVNIQLLVQRPERQSNAMIKDPLSKAKICGNTK